MGYHQIACFVVIATEEKKEKLEKRNNYLRAISCKAQTASHLTPSPNSGNTQSIYHAG